MFEWIKDHDVLITVFGVFSLVVFVASLIIMPIVVARIPADYFTHAHRPKTWIAGKPAPMRLALRFGKNVLGLLLFLAGAAMLVLPGQGVLTMLVGLLLIDGPGKYRFQKWLIHKSWVHRPIDWLRKRRGREPLQLEASQ